jgi:hypothetical protein
MKDRFGVARCCCESFCEDCCNGNAPTEWDVEAQYTDDKCTTCNEDASGVFTLARAGGICRWRFLREKASGWNPECVANYATYGNEFRKQEIALDVRCINETQYRVRAFTTLTAYYATGIEYNTQQSAVPPYYWPQGYPISTRNFFRTVDVVYETTIDFTDFNCNEQNAFELPFSQAVLGWSLEFLYPYPIFGDQWVFSSGSATYNALPVGPYLNWGLRACTTGSPPAFIDVSAPCQPPANLILTAIP